MKKSTKAVLLSGLVFPGLGHLYLRRWVVGVALSGVAAFAIYYIASIAMTIVLDVSRKIETGAMTADIATITHAVSQQFSGVEQATNIASTTLLLCWVTGIAGCYWQGRKQDTLNAQ